MIAQQLDRVLTAYRIGDPDGRYPIFDATGSRLSPGRWNTAETPVIYASEHYATSMLERLAGGMGQLPPNQHFVEIVIPKGMSYEMANLAHIPGWDAPRGASARAYAAAWHREQRSAILLVPSVVARMERNVVMNVLHPEFPRIAHGLHQPVWWDARLFGAG